MRPKEMQADERRARSLWDVLLSLAPCARGLWLIPGLALAQHTGRSWLKARHR